MSTTADPALFDPDLWSPLSDTERRGMLSSALLGELEGAPGVQGTRIEVGPVGRTYDLTAVVETDVGDLRTPLWSHVRASIFCDASIHPANRRQLAPGLAVRVAAENFRARLAVPIALEARGATLTLTPEAGVERAWIAERSRFRGKTTVTREDRIGNPPEDLDLRNLLAHFYTGQGLRLVDSEGNALLLPGQVDPEDGPLVSLCGTCHRWTDGPVEACPECSSAVDTVVATRPARR
jgi:hypothetical protein